MDGLYTDRMRKRRWGYVFLGLGIVLFHVCVVCVRFDLSGVGGVLKDVSVYHRPFLEAEVLPIQQRGILGGYSFWGALNGALATAQQKIQLDIEARQQLGTAAGGMLLSDYDTDQLKFRIARTAAVGWVAVYRQPLGIVCMMLCCIGVLFVLWGREPSASPYFGAWSKRGVLAVGLSVYLLGFYVVLYWYPYYLVGGVLLADSISYWLHGGSADPWYFYGLVYTLGVLLMGVRMLVKHRANRYQQWRTLANLFFQLVVAFLLVDVLRALNLPAADLKNMWPLDYSFFFDYRLAAAQSKGAVGYAVLVWGIVLFVVGVPFMTYFLGKRWYCSWVCGCGALAENVGDPFRQHSSKSVGAWRIERYVVHTVLVLAVVMTLGVLYTYFTGVATLGGVNSYTLRSAYGFYIGGIFSGVLGTGLYPLLGSRFWCRFGCPLAAYLGIIQRYFSRFRITVNGGQCISCGQCSTYCEQGIDVRAYAQRGQSIVRASCVGCGVCAAVCPRGVLRLENATNDVPNHGRTIHVPLSDVGILG